MQRTHRILKKRGGFILIAAVFMMLAISFLLLRMLASTAEGSQRTINDYIHEQAILLTYAATEEVIDKIIREEKRQIDLLNEELSKT